MMPLEQALLDEHPLIRVQAESELLLEAGTAVADRSMIDESNLVKLWKHNRAVIAWHRAGRVGPAPLMWPKSAAPALEAGQEHELATV